MIQTTCSGIVKVDGEERAKRFVLTVALLVIEATPRWVSESLPADRANAAKLPKHMAMPALEAFGVRPLLDS